MGGAPSTADESSTADEYGEVRPSVRNRIRSEGDDLVNGDRPRVCGLLCGRRENPIGVAPDRVRFSWKVEGPLPRWRQGGYQVLVGEAPGALEGLDLVWDSGHVSSSNSTDVPYEGAGLLRSRSYFWKVRVFDERGAESYWSDVASFEVELDPHQDWHGEWIGLGRESFVMDPPEGVGPVDPIRNAQAPAPYLRRSFGVEAPIVFARLYITALGLYEARLNGRRIGAAVLTPGWTDYSQRVQYQSYDVTELVRTGDNVLAVVLGDGWYSGFFGFQAKHAGAHYGERPLALVELVMRDASGREVRIASDGSWRSSTGGIRRADLLMGESFDCAREPVGWDRSGFDASLWAPVCCLPRDERLLVADPGPEIRITEELAAVEMRSGNDGRVVVDFGQNLAGWTRLRVRPGAHSHVCIRHGEVLAEDGSLYTDNLRAARQCDEVKVYGDEFVFEPCHTFHGFRYAEVSGYPGELTAGDITAQVVHSDIPRSGSFECSSQRVNRLYANIEWGQRGNFIGIPTDCPQRDERLGWLGDAQIFARTATYNRDVSAFFDKWLDDVRDAQLPSGAFSDVAPRLGLDWGGAPAWGDAGIIVPWTIYRMYGVRSVLERNFSAMRAWMDFVAQGNDGYLRSANLGNNYGDWLAPRRDETPRELLATAYWAYDAQLMSEIADAIDQPEAASDYRELVGKIRRAFDEAFVEPDGHVRSDTQTAYVLALHMGLVPDALRAAAARNLVRAVERDDWHLSTGFVGVGYLLPVLSQNGYDDVAYRLLEQDSFPSWLYTVDRGATTIWERWDGFTEEGGFQSPEMNSFNHYSLGSVGEWLYRFVLGIEPAPDAVGFEQISLRPHPGGSLTSARGSYESVRGRIAASWERAGDMLRFSVEIPPSVHGRVHIPSADPAAVREAGGRSASMIADFPGKLGVREAVFDVGSGSYAFSGPLPDFLR